MTNEEAMKCIEDVLDSDYHYDESLGYQLTSGDFEWLEKAKEALEKQIPQKPRITLHGTTDYNTTCKCRSCGSFVNTTDNYCRTCGQAIERSVGE